LPHTVVPARLPDSVDDLHATEIATLDGVTYIALPAGLVLPSQPTEIALEPAALTPELLKALKAASPHARLIAERMEMKIRSRYSQGDEQYFARIGVGAALGMYEFGPGEVDELTAFGTFVESVRQWGRSERAKLGL
jgi:hypothetical protein